MEHLKEIISLPPLGPFLVKISGDFMFLSIYIFILGLVIIGIISTSLQIRNKGRPAGRIWIVNLILSCILVLFLGIVNMLFYFIRN